MKVHFVILLLVVLFGVFASADPIPAGWTCTGYCGSSGLDGVVTVSPLGSGTYEWVSTWGGQGGVGSLPGVGGVGNPTNGSVLQSSTFTANGVDVLDFYFNYVTSDGGTYVDYGWVQLVNADTLASIILFTARTTPGGDTVPGFSMPGLEPGVTLNPGSTPIIPGGPAWSPLGFYSGWCWDAGCGYTGWIEAQYIPVAGNYYLLFGVTNWDDEVYDSGLAIDGVKIGNTPIDDDAVVPEPSSLLLLGSGLLGLAGTIRRKLIG